MAYDKTLTKKDIDGLAFRTSLIQACFTFERGLGIGWTYVLSSCLKKIYKDDEEKLAEALEDNMAYMSTNLTAAAFLAGLIAAAEEDKTDRDIPNNLRLALFGPLAGIGDALLWFTVLPIVAGICSSFASQGNVLGPILFFVIYVGIFLARIPLARLGYSLGTKTIGHIKDLSNLVTRAAATLGITVIGGLIASFVSINVVASIPVSEGYEISLQTDFFDNILPNILPLGYTLLMFYLLKYKKINPVCLIMITFFLAIVCSFFGIL